MHAMILAAGRGERMRPLTDHTPKPLLEVAGRPLIEYLIRALAKAGCEQLVINVSYRADQIERTLADGRRLGVAIRYSREPDGALESGGGIHRALPLIDGEVFVVVNGDVWTDYPFSGLPSAPSGLAHLVLVDNPAHHPAGDFALVQGRVRSAGNPKLTFSGIGVYRKELFTHLSPGRFPLAPILRDAMERDRVSGEHYGGHWLDVGTPERLRALEARLTRAG